MQYLSRLTNNFPINEIPHQTDDEAMIDTLKAEIKQTKIEIFIVDKKSDLSKAQKLMKTKELQKKLKDCSQKLMSIYDLHKNEAKQDKNDGV